jgi:uncharacterized protein YegP (UPF0339 family)
MSVQFTIRRNGHLQYYFQFSDTAGDPLFTSDTYYMKTSCESGIETVRRCADRDTSIGLRSEENGEAYFVLYSDTGVMLGRSIDFSNRAMLDKGLALFRRSAAEAPVQELVP